MSSVNAWATALIFTLLIVFILSLVVVNLYSKSEQYKAKAQMYEERHERLLAVRRDERYAFNRLKVKYDALEAQVNEQMLNEEAMAYVHESLRRAADGDINKIGEA